MNEPLPELMTCRDVFEELELPSPSHAWRLVKSLGVPVIMSSGPPALAARFYRSDFEERYAPLAAQAEALAAAMEPEPEEIVTPPAPSPPAWPETETMSVYQLAQLLGISPGKALRLARTLEVRYLPGASAGRDVSSTALLTADVKAALARKAEHDARAFQAGFSPWPPLSFDPPAEDEIDAAELGRRFSVPAHKAWTWVSRLGVPAVVRTLQGTPSGSPWPVARFRWADVLSALERVTLADRETRREAYLKQIRAEERKGARKS